MSTPEYLTIDAYIGPFPEITAKFKKSAEEYIKEGVDQYEAEIAAAVDHDLEWVETENGGYYVQKIQARVRYVGVYQNVWEYLGPEEGGCCGMASHHILSIPTNGCQEDVDTVKAFLATRYESHGDIYSVRPGVEYQLLLEHEEGEHEHIPSRQYQ